MHKTFLLLSIAFAVLAPAVEGQNLLRSAEISIQRAAERPPTSYHYLEKAGAFGINRKKERAYSIEMSGDRLVSTVTFANEGRHHKDDPRPPSQVGDTELYDFQKVVNDFSPFNPVLNTGIYTGPEDAHIKGTRVSKYTFSYTTFVDDGSGYPTRGEMYVDAETGMVRRIHAIREESPDEVDGEFWILDFDGTGTEDCRLVSRYYEKKGKYAIFVYKFRTTDTFLY